MEEVELGGTGLRVSRLGIGGAEVGYLGLSEEQAGDLLNTALDLGINFVDTAAAYGNGEELTGASISNRRSEYVLASKCSPGTPEEIAVSIDRSLKLLRTDVIDIMQLHGGDADYLRDGSGVAAMQKARDAGKVRFLGYSGDGENALEAIRLGVFATLQLSFNIVDQAARDAGVLEAATRTRMGVIAKRPLANAVLGHPKNPNQGTVWENYTQRYWELGHDLEIPEGAPANLVELALRFTLSEPRIHVAIAGTSNPTHLRQNVAFADAGPLPEQLLDALISAA